MSFQAMMRDQAVERSGRRIEYRSSIVDGGDPANPVIVLRLEFASVEDLEGFFLGLIGKPYMRECATKAIGRVLLIWNR